jgi:hypothetical protein
VNDGIDIAHGDERAHERFTEQEKARTGVGADLRPASRNSIPVSAAAHPPFEQWSLATTSARCRDYGG